MKEKICCILEEEDYAIQLSEYISKNNIFKYKTLAFTSVEAVCNCIAKYEIEVLISAEDLDSKVRAILLPRVHILLTDVTDGEQHWVNRYQSADRLVRDIVAQLDNYEAGGDCNGTQIYMVYSPAGNCGKTTLALALAAKAAERGNALFISLEQFSGLDRLVPDAKGLSEALYQYSINPDSRGKIMACIDQLENFSYLAPVECADDIVECNEEIVEKIIMGIAAQGVFRSIIIDADRVIKRPWKFFTESVCVFVPQSVSASGRRKVEALKRYLLLSGFEDMANRLTEVSVPYIEQLANREICAQTFMNRDILEVAARCLDGKSD